MTQPYLDTGLVVKLIVEEPLSGRVRTFLQRRAVAVGYTRLIEIETVNTLHAKHFRKEISALQLKQCLALVEELLREGRFFRPALSLDDVALETLRELPAITAATGCRTLDLMHVASAKLLGWQEFVSSDQRQLQAAAKADLKVVDIVNDSKAC